MTADPTAAVDKIPLQTRNPIPLSAGQEAQVRDIYYARVRGYCAEEIKQFAQCAVNRTFSATWKCRTERLAMNSCMAVHATAEEQDRAREEWFVTMEERRKKREEKELKRREQEQFHREWWGLDEQGRRIEKDPKKSVFGLSDGEKNAKR